jgi:hypothetical protein
LLKGIEVAACRRLAVRPRRKSRRRAFNVWSEFTLPIAGSVTVPAGLIAAYAASMLVVEHY